MKSEGITKKLCLFVFPLKQAEISYKANPKMLDQYQYAEKAVIPFLAVIGEQELKDGVVTLRDTKTREEVGSRDKQNVEFIKINWLRQLT